MEFLTGEYTNTFLEPIALKTFAILPHVICQKTHEKKTADELKAVRRMERWKAGDIHAEASPCRNRKKKCQGEK